MFCMQCISSRNFHGNQTTISYSLNNEFASVMHTLLDKFASLNHFQCNVFFTIPSYFTINIFVQFRVLNHLFKALSDPKLS